MFDSITFDFDVNFGCPSISDDVSLFSSIPTLLSIHAVLLIFWHRQYCSAIDYLETHVSEMMYCVSKATL